MKIIKLIKRNLLGFIVGIIVATGVTTVALTVASKDVTYNNTNVESAINDLYSRVGDVSSVDTPVILDTSRFNSSTFNTLVFSYLGSSGGNYNEGFCTQTRVNMDLVSKITIPKMAHYHTYAPIAYIAFFDEYTSDYNTIVNNAVSSKGWSGNTSDSWAHTTVNWVIDTSSIKGYKYIAMAYTQNNTSYSSHIISPESVTIN